MCIARNLFLLPLGQAGKQFIDKAARLMNERLLASPMKNIAFNAIMKMLSLLFSTSVEIVHLTELLHEGIAIQKELKLPKGPSSITNIYK